MRYAVAFALLLLVAFQAKTINQVVKMQGQIFDLHQTVSCLEGGNKVDQKFNVGPDEYNRICMLDGKPWISWRRG